MAHVLDEMYKTLAEEAISLGIPCDDSPTGPLAAWLVTRVQHRPETLFFIVLGVAGEIADIQARAQGYESAAHRAAVRAFEKTS